MAISSVKDVSQVILRQTGSISNLKLQKLLYYVQAWSLAFYDKPAFAGRIEAWVHGPVIPDAFHMYRHFRWNPIEPSTEKVELPDSELLHIKKVLSVYGSFTATQLEEFSHEEDPWLEARKGLPSRQASSAVITEDSMKSFFKARLDA